MAGDAALTRKRAPSSCQAGQLTMARGFGGAAALSSAIADMIHKKSVCNSFKTTRSPAA